MCDELGKLFSMLLGGRDDGRPDPHAHKCPSCSHIWKHDRANIHSAADNHAAHTCPSCGDSSDGCWDRYRGPIPRDCSRVRI